MTATILTGLGVLAALAWIGLHGIGAITLARVARLPALAPGSRSRPTLSVVLAACNEQDSIERSVCSLLEQAYSGLEVVLVDDRSTDGTGEIADRLAAGDPRVRVVHVTDLPAGWLGKVHALQRGTDAATGEFLPQRPAFFLGYHAVGTGQLQVGGRYQQPQAGRRQHRRQHYVAHLSLADGEPLLGQPHEQ